MFTKPALKRIALSILKAFAAAAFGYVIVHEADIVSGNLNVIKGVIISAIIAGLDGAFKAVQIAVAG